MVYKGSKIFVCDNTGIKTVKILQVYNKKSALAGDILLTVIRRKKFLKKFVKKKINYVFFFSQKKPVFRKQGFYYLKMLKSQCIVLGADQEKILGTRHFGYLTLESKKRAFSQMVRSSRVIL